VTKRTRILAKKGRGWGGGKKRNQKAKDFIAAVVGESTMDHTFPGLAPKKVGGLSQHSPQKKKKKVTSMTLLFIFFEEKERGGNKSSMQKRGKKERYQKGNE